MNFRRNSLLRAVPLVCMGMVLATGLSASARERSLAEKLEFFEKRVRPVLVENCQSCHGAKKQRGGLRLDSRKAILKGGDSGPAVLPGKPEASVLLKAVRHEDADLVMPPREKLEDTEIAALEQWIRVGAPWPAGESPGKPALGDQEHIGIVAQKHWAFQPVSKPKLPAVKNQEWLKTPVDAFILAPLEEKGLQPSRRADRRTLLRRIYFDLIGLPPTPKQMQAFLDDTSPQAFARVVDELLESKHYGERWGRYWLDIARYADTRDWAPQIDLRYPFAYTYRDWVIQALNQDMPYDQFIKLQIAADAYVKETDSPQLAALGFLTVGPRFRNRVLEQTADRIDVVTRGIMGLTVMCARCHDHKYDPIPTEDYYSLYGVFASTEEPEEFPVIAGFSPPADQVQAYRKKRQEKLADLEAYKEKLRKEALAELRLRIGAYLEGYHDMNLTRKASIRSLISKRKLKHTAMTPLARNLDRVTKQARWRRHPVMGVWANVLGVPEKQFPVALKKALNQRGINPLVKTALTTNPPKTRSEFLVRYGELLQRAQNAWQQALKESKDARRLANPALEEIRQVLYMANGPFVLDKEEVLRASFLLGAGRRAYGKLQGAIQEIEATHPGSPARAMVLQDKSRPITPRVFVRGDPRRRGDAVPRRFLSILAGKDAPRFTEGSGRRELAEAIADPTNPLTTRVLVNRVWMHHFGQGLVSSPGDFGLRTGPPTHPALLDWLAATFVEQGWSLKKLHKLLVLSNTYQQTSTSTSQEAERLDPENRLLWRANRQRLDFEAMRDALLVVSGQLDPKLGGRAVKLTQRPFSARRTIYGFVDRVNLDDLFSTFDFPAPDASSPERAETLVPQQALFGMNDPFVVEQARKLAKLPAFLKLSTPEARVQFLYRRMFGREANTREVLLTKRFVQAAGSDTRQLGGSPWQYGYGPADAPAGKATFQPLAVWTGRWYQAGKNFPDPRLGHLRLTANGGHPGRTPHQAIIRRWTAPCDAVIAIDGKLAHLRDKGDGVRGQIRASRGGVLGKWTVFNESTSTPVARYAVKAGEIIDFVVDCRSRPTADAFLWAPTIRVLGAGGGKATMWNARRDFGAPPPPPLQPWAQVAQALMLTNEFLFVD